MPSMLGVNPVLILRGCLQEALQGVEGVGLCELGFRRKAQVSEFPRVSPHQALGLGSLYIYFIQSLC